VNYKDHTREDHPESPSMGPFNNLRGLPYFNEPATYMHMGGALWAFEFNGWKLESMSWKEGCYIHAGISNSQITFTGPDVIPFFASICTNSFAKFSVGSLKHAVMCSETGYVVTHGILQRDSEDQVSWYAGGTWPVYMLSKTTYDVKAEFASRFLFQVAGPTSLETLERAAGESLGDIKFLRYRTTTIAGKPVEIARIGMSGNLAYEVRGALDDGPTVHLAIFEAGQSLGIQRLGWRTYLVNHVEGGFPQISWTFHTAFTEDKDCPPMYYDNTPMIPTGSVDPADLKARFRNPLELKWTQSVKFDHEFVGREALEKIAAGTRMTCWISTPPCCSRERSIRRSICRSRLRQRAG
jgi:vanillate/3-O-methylgallate O-demethylase